jgi:teichuronic acid biosynthesis protein TuaE
LNAETGDCASGPEGRATFGQSRKPDSLSIGRAIPGWIRFAITCTAGLTCATASLRSLAVPLQLPLIGLLHAFKISLFLLFLFCLFYATTWRSTTRVKLCAPVRRYWLMLSMWLFWLALSLFWTSDLQNGLLYVARFSTMLFLAAILVLAVGTSEKRLQLCFGILFSVCVIVVVLGVVEQQTGSRTTEIALRNLAESALLEERFAYAIYSFFNQPNDFGTYLTIWLPFLVVAMFVAPSWRLRLGAGILSAICLYDIFFTLSRLNYAGAVLTILAAPVFSFSGRKALGRVLALQMVVVLCFVGLAVATGPRLGTMLSERARPKLDESAREFSRPSEGTSVGTRIQLIGAVIGALEESWMAGTGAGSAERYLAKAGMVVHNYHSWWAETLATGGVVAFLLYLVLYFSMLVRLYRSGGNHQGTWLGHLGRAISLSLCALIIGQNAPSSVLYFPAMWVLFGLAMATLNVMEAKGEACKS